MPGLTKLRQLFTKMAPKAKKEAPAPPEAKAEAKALKAKKAVWKGVHSHTHTKKKIRTSLTFRWPKTLRLRRQPKYPQKSPLGETSLTTVPPSSPHHWVRHEENRRRQGTSLPCWSAGVVKNPPANAGDMGLSPGPTCLGATKPVHQTTEAHAPRARALLQEKPLQWKARAPQRRVASAHHK